MGIATDYEASPSPRLRQSHAGDGTQRKRNSGWTVPQLQPAGPFLEQAVCRQPVIQRHASSLESHMRAIQALAASAALLLFVAARAPAQQAPYTEGSVWNLTFIRVKPAMGDQYLNDLRGTIARQFAEAKRQGLLLSWKRLDRPRRTATTGTS